MAAMKKLRGALRVNCTVSGATTPTFCTASNTLFRGLRIRGGEDDVVKAGLHVVGGEGSAIMELDPVSQMEGVRQPIAGHLPRVGQVRDDRLAAVQRVVAQQSIVHGFQGRGAGGGIALVQVEERGICQSSPPQDTAILGGALLRPQHGRGRGRRGGSGGQRLPWVRGGDCGPTDDCDQHEQRHLDQKRRPNPHSSGIGHDWTSCMLPKMPRIWQVTGVPLSNLRLAFLGFLWLYRPPHIRCLTRYSAPRQYSTSS